MTSTTLEVMMLRLKTTTEHGKVFLGPFVYNIKSEKRIKQKLDELNWLLPKYKDHEGVWRLKGKADMELIEVTEYPKQAVYTPHTERSLWKVINLENQWEELCAKQLLKEH
jgi:hypothetical protein